MRFSGQVQPFIPATAPLSYRLSNEVYSMDGLGACACQKSAMGDFYGVPNLVVFGAVAAVALWFLMKKR